MEDIEEKTTPTNIRTEAVAGLTTFLTMAYIVVVNPQILSTPGTGISFSGALTATVLVCFTMTLMMGLYAKLPFAVAPGMGLNAFFTFSIILGQQVPWQTALGIVFWAGVLFLIISVTPVRVAIARAIPKNLRIAAAAGIGIFLTFIGLKNAGFVVADAHTFVKFGELGYPSLATLSGIVLTIFLLKKKKLVRLFGRNRFCYSGGLALGLGRNSERDFQPSGFFQRVFPARHLGRAQTRAPARHYLDHVYRSFRFAFDFYGSFARRRALGRKRRAEKFAKGVDR